MENPFEDITQLLNKVLAGQAELKELLSKEANPYEPVYISDIANDLGISERAVKDRIEKLSHIKIGHEGKDRRKPTIQKRFEAEVKKGRVIKLKKAS